MGAGQAPITPPDQLVSFRCLKLFGAPLNDYTTNDKALMHTNQTTTANDIWPGIVENAARNRLKETYGSREGGSKFEALA